METNNIAISINKDSCIKCGRCARVCPHKIMNQDKKGEILVTHIDFCSRCGHCVDVCPTDSIQHSTFSSENIHTIDYSTLPTPEQVMLLIKSRRSNRSMTSNPIPKEMLEQIIEAAQYAPTAVNTRQISFTIITEHDKLEDISNFTIKTFGSLTKILKNPIVKCVLKPFLEDVYKNIPLLEKFKEEQKKGNDPILRKATVLLIIHTPKSNRWGKAEANMAYQNASLMAQSLGISQIYMGFVLKAIEQDCKGSLLKKLGITGKVQAVMALGLPTFKYPKYVDR